MSGTFKRSDLCFRTGNEWILQCREVIYSISKCDCEGFQDGNDSDHRKVSVEATCKGDSSGENRDGKNLKWRSIDKMEKNSVGPVG